MSQESVELVRRIFEVWNGPEIGVDESVQEFFDPAIRMDLTGRKLNPAVYDGYEGITRFTAEVGEVWDDFRIELVELIDLAPCAVSVMRAVAQGRGSGVEVVGEMAWVWTVSDGRVVQVQGDFDRDAALEAAGLSE